eukprot:jgi/Undpi1/8029/HiC_scaffold_24.g10501.m1
MGQLKLESSHNPQIPASTIWPEDDVLKHQPLDPDQRGTLDGTRARNGLDNTDDNSLLSVNYAGFAPVLVEGFKELQDRIVDLEQHQQQLLHGRQQPGIADEVTTEGVTTSRDSTVIRRGRHAWGGIDVFEREAKILADELGCNCQQDLNRIGRLERQVLELQRKLEGGTALPSG